MSDKSFGDHVNRNIVKNPLLSTAVTGLSIEDLTHNAVLLPAAPTQPLITRSEYQIGTQAHTLEHPDNELANHPSGDSNSNIPPSHHSITSAQSTLNIQTSTQSDLASDNLRSTQSKAFPKSEDDFDVNEYFARLQGTRYVSAPLHSQISDQNANLDAEEDNLEEINLNDDKPDTQQSITADIAQNFSQLPTVLPHMASAVFSSFSNMLNLKSREHTPDEGKVQSVTQADTVPLMSVENVAKEIAPPPKEMSVSGASNYRITTKKKYAQIPGLSSGETQPVAYNPVSQAVPSYFVPSVQDSCVNFGEHVDNTKQVDESRNEQAKPSTSENNFNIFQPIDNDDAVKSYSNRIEEIKPAIIDPFSVHNPINVAADVKECDFQPIIPLLPANDSEINFPHSQLAMQANVIPPPPMFSTQRRDSQNTGKAVLPPSVARRIGSNHPVIKQQTIQTTKLADNIFVPTFDPLPTNEALQSVHEPPSVPVSHAPTFAETQALNDSVQSATQTQFSSLPPAKSFIPFSRPMQTTIGFQPSTSFVAPPKNQAATNLQLHTLAPLPSNTPTIFTPPTLLPSTAVPSAVTNIFTPKETEAHLLPPMSSQSVAVTSAAKPGVSSMFESQSSTNLPPFYNTMSIQDNTNPKIPGPLYPPPDEPKSLQIPPKSSGGVNYRMTKKRPQYYSGPIEGVGAISNNTKPVLPPIETGTFQGALFTPEQGIQPNPNVTSTPFDISQNIATVAFDISQPKLRMASTSFDISQNTATVPFDISGAPSSQTAMVFDMSNSGDNAPHSSHVKPQEQAQSYFNTVFDLSRPTTETYHEETKETTGFGIIGSLKSKLSSLDINKIQNTVTTFFDPAFNESKNDNSNAQETAPYQTSQYQGQSNFEILVPNIQETPQAYGSYDSQSQNSYFQSNQYYSNQQNYYQSQDQTLTGLYQSPEVSYPNYSTFAAQTQLTSTESIAHSSLFNPQGLINTSTQEKLKESGENVTLFSDRSTKSDVLGHTNKDMEKTASHFDIFQDSSKIDQTLQAQDILSVEEKSATNYFDMSTSKSADIHAKTYDVDKEPTFLTAVHAPSKEKSNTDLFSPIKYEQQNVHAFVQPSSFHSMATSIEDYKSVDVFSTKFDAKSTKQKFPKADNLLESISRDEIPIVGVSSVPLFGLSTMIVGKTKESIEVEDTKMPSLDKDLIDRNASISFFENIPPIKPVDDENVSELNICETCREFNKPEENDKELDDLTTQLIENITSPIQLSNPVEVPLTEGSTAVNDNDNEFDKNQFEEISHITEETIETIQVQSATELLDDVDEDLPRNYGWATQEDYDSSSINTNVLLEHDYNFKIDTNSLGFYGNNSLFFDNVPTNASDEIKAEFKHHEDFPKEVPTAPPVEDDTKSDETGVLDVQSIELDAKKDFPIYEEFVIEPSETDDDKIEYKEREKTEESQERDTFTNRVERFKKMDNDDHNDHKTIFELSSPPISMASYFDTGNFAAETHYRKSISSPSQIRIPPGFEEEFHSRLTVTKPVHDIKTVPDTSTQTRPTEALSFSTVQNIAPVGFNIETNITKLVEEGSEKPPAFSTFLASEDRKKHIDIQPSIFSGLVTGLDGEKHFTAAIDTKEVSESESHIPGLVSSNLLSGDVTSVFGMQSDSKRINLVSGLIGANVTEDRHISNIYGDPKEDLSDIPTSLIPTNLVEDVNINRMFDQEAEITQKDWVATNLLDGTSLKPAFDGTDKRKDVDTPPTVAANVLPKSSAEDRLFTVGFVQKQDSNVNATTDIITALPTSNVFQGNDSTVKDQSKPEIVEVVDKTGKLPEFLSVFGPKTSAPKKEEQKLPDPMNFFSSGDNPVEAPETFNRLASYFASPPKTDHGKSFFELSQSQNHYRHDTVSIQTRNDKYSDLIKDLTSPQNITAPKDQIVRHINYFTVECNPELKKNQTGDIKNVIESAETENIAQIDNIFNKCEYCSKCLNCKNYKFRTLMDDTNPEKEKTGSNMDEAKDTSRRPVSVNFENITLHEEANEGVSMLSEGRSSPEYTSVKHHWFYRVDVEDKSIWRGFSIVDSKSLEMAYLSPDLTETTLVPTDGGRYDVNVVGRLRVPVYWDDKPTNVRRWFYKGATDARYVPYTEQVAEKLEEEYRHGMIRGEWHRRLLLPNGEVVVMHGPGVMVHFLHSSAADTFSSSPATTRPRVVRRGHDESEIEDTEPSSIDHLLLLCHGVGSACDMRFRSVEEVVEDFRATSLQLLQSHYRNSYDKGIVNRIEVLPISWHSSLHSGETGVDRRLAQITLHSIPRLRHFTNDTILDVLFYTSPVFCQTILDTVCRELNRIYKLFKQRNPDFKGGVSVGGHSLGSVILYDLLCNQTVEAETDTAKSQSQKTYVAGCSRMSMKYPILEFHPDSLYALGSPIAIFECIRGVESLGLNFDLPTCKNFFNIFHPYDPIAYRIEPLVNPELKNLKPFLIPHHKGRKRMHLELKDTMARVGADLKQKLLDSLRMTWNKWKAQPDEGHLSNVVEEEAEKDQIVDESREDSLQDNEMSTPEMLGRLNDGRRIDYVLQEAPLEMINEYIFAMSSHVGYWESEDTMLLMLREIYGALGVQPDSTVPQQTMTVQRARNSRQDEYLVVNTSDYPSTSHGGI